MAASPRIYEGDVSLQRVDPVTRIPFGPEVILNCDAFAPGAEEAEAQQLLSKKRGTYGQVLAEVTTPGAATLSATFNELDPFLLSVAFRGTGSVITQTTGNFTAEPLVVTALGVWHDITQDVSSVDVRRYQLLADPAPVVTDNADPVNPLTEGVDFELDRRWGRIRFLTGGSVSVDDTVLITASYAAYSAEKIVGNIAPNALFRVVLNGRDRITGRDILLTAWEANLTPSSDPDMLSSEFISVELSGSLIVPPGREGPYEVIVQTG